MLAHFPIYLEICFYTNRMSVTGGLMRGQAGEEWKVSFDLAVRESLVIFLCVIGGQKEWRPV